MSIGLDTAAALAELVKNDFLGGSGGGRLCCRARAWFLAVAEPGVGLIFKGSPPPSNGDVFEGIPPHGVSGLFGVLLAECVGDAVDVDVRRLELLLGLISVVL